MVGLNEVSTLGQLPVKVDLTLVNGLLTFLQKHLNAILIKILAFNSELVHGIIESRGQIASRQCFHTDGCSNSRYFCAGIPVMLLMDFVQSVSVSFLY